MIDLKNLGPISNLKSFKQGEVIIRENDTLISEMFILLAGTVGVYKAFDSEHPLHISELQPGSVFGEMSLFTNEPRSTSVVASTNVTAICISKENFFQVIQENPSATIQIIESLCKRLSEVNDRMVAMNNALSPVSPTNSPPKEIKAQPSISLSLFPENHGIYPTQEPASFASYTLSTNVTCPFCETTFLAKMPYVSKLKISKTTDCDMRKHTVDFDTTWYDIITCPHCYFSSFTTFFDNKAIFSKTAEIQNVLEKIKKETILDFDQPRTLDFVFAMYYLSLICAKSYTNEKQIIAKLWLQLSYLYEDTNDSVMYLYAITKASESYELFYGTSNMKVEQEQSCCLILAHLFFVLSQLDKSMFYLTKVRTNKEGPAMFKRLCDVKIDEIREYRRSLKEKNN
ncbi:MAG: DUF2225 domain-containing protein [Oscillospiraceae bacterium]